MKYVHPELKLIRFDGLDVLTSSLPIIPKEVGDEPESTEGAEF